MVVRHGVLLIVLAAVFGAAGCGGSGAVARTDPAPKPTAVTTTSAPAEPKVSEKTTCDLLFNAGENPLNLVLDFLQRDNSTTAQTQKAKDAIGRIDQIAATADGDLGTQLAELVSQFQEVIARLEQTGQLTYEAGPMKAAGLEVTNVCSQYY